MFLCSLKLKLFPIKPSLMPMLFDPESPCRSLFANENKL
jgi:hypothetical protein